MDFCVQPPKGWFFFSKHLDKVKVLGYNYWLFEHYQEGGVFMIETPFICGNKVVYAPNEEEAKRWVESLQKGECPDCGGDRFFRGPEGGGAVNYYCANPNCSQGWNIAFFIERIGKGLDDFPEWYHPEEDEVEKSTTTMKV